MHPLLGVIINRQVVDKLINQLLVVGCRKSHHGKQNLYNYNYERISGFFCFAERCVRWKLWFLMESSSDFSNREASITSGVEFPGPAWLRIPFCTFYTQQVFMSSSYFNDFSNKIKCVQNDKRKS